MGTLELRIEAKCYDDCKETADFVPVATLAAAKGISAIQNLANNSIACCDNACAAGGNGLAVLEHNFQRASTTSQEAEILYKINSSVVNKKQLTAEQIALFQEAMTSPSDVLGGKSLYEKYGEGLEEYIDAIKAVGEGM